MDLKGIKLKINYGEKDDLVFYINSVHKPHYDELKPIMTLAELGTIRICAENSQAHPNTQETELLRIENFSYKKNFGEAALLLRSFQKNEEATSEKKYFTSSRFAKNTDLEPILIRNLTKKITKLLIKKGYNLIVLNKPTISLPFESKKHLISLIKFKEAMSDLIETEDPPQLPFLNFQPQSFFIALKELKMEISDSIPEQLYMRFAKVHRHFCSKQEIPDPKAIIHQLKMLKNYNRKMLTFSLKEICIDISSPFIETDQKQLYKKAMGFINKTDRFSSVLQRSFIHRLGGMEFKILAHTFCIYIRDIPIHLFSFKFASLEMKTISLQLEENKCKQFQYDFGFQKIFFELELFIDKPVLYFGLNLLPHLQSLIKYLKKNLDLPKKKEPKAPQSSALKEPLFWNKLRYRLHGRTKIRIKNLGLRILTNVSPYIGNFLGVGIKILNFGQEEQQFKALAQDLVFFRFIENSAATQELNEFWFKSSKDPPFIKIPKTEILIKWDWNAKSQSENHYFVIKGLRMLERLGGGNNIEENYSSEFISAIVNINFPKQVFFF